MRTALIIGGSIVGFLATSVGFYVWGRHNGLKAAGVDPASYKEEKKRQARAA